MLIMTIYLLSTVNVSQPDTNNNQVRQFHGIANSGKPFNYNGKMAIVDLSSITFHDKLPALIVHDSNQRAGFGYLSVKNNQLFIHGQLLDNIHGNTVAKESDAGLPWQMSAHLIAQHIEELTGNQTAVVNGQIITAPMLILRQCHIPEISFTPIGVDNQTSAIVLSGHNTTTYPIAINKDNPMTVEELQTENTQLKQQNQKLLSEIAELKQQIDKMSQLQKQTTIDVELSQAGFNRTQDGKGWQNLSDATLNILLSAKVDDAKAMIADLAKSNLVKAIPEILLSEQYPLTVHSHQSQVINPMIANAKARNPASKNFV